MPKRKSKRIELTIEAIRALSIQAAKKDTKFKPYVESLLEEIAKKS